MLEDRIYLQRASKKQYHLPDVQLNNMLIWLGGIIIPAAAITDT